VADVRREVVSPSFAGPGHLVSDDYNGYAKYQVRLTARQLCNAHLIRSAKGVAEAEPCRHAWAAAMIEVLRTGPKSVTDAVAAGRSTLAGQEIEQIRAAYREQAQAGITANLGRRTSKGDKHPAWVLAQRFHDKIDLILHHLTDFTVPWTSDLASLCTSWVRSGVSGFSRWSGGVADVIVARGTDISRWLQRAAQARVVAAP